MDTKKLLESTLQYENREVTGQAVGLACDAVMDLREAVAEQGQRIAELEKVNAALLATLDSVGESRAKLIATSNGIPRELSISETVNAFHVLYGAIKAFVDETNPDR